MSITGGTIAAPADEPVIRLIEALNGIMSQFRTMTGEKLFLTIAPETAYVQGGQSAFGGIWGAYLPVIHALRDSLDILQVQLYNSGSMFGLDGGIYTQGTADFIVSQTEAVIQGFSTGGGEFPGLSAEKVAVALPACSAAAGGGYTDTATVRLAMEYLLGQGPQPGAYTLQVPGGYPALRGLMTWSINWDAVPTCDGADGFAENFERIFGDTPTGIVDTGRPGSRAYYDPDTDLLWCTACGAVVLYDQLGRRILFDRRNSSGTTLDLSSLNDGVYLVVEDVQGHAKAHRFVKY